VAADDPTAALAAAGGGAKDGGSATEGVWRAYLVSGYTTIRRSIMPEPAVTRLTISWSKDTDLALRSHLGSQGLKKGSLSRFIEDAVKWRLFHQSVDEVRGAFAGVPAAEIHAMIGEAVESVRKDTHRRRAGRPRK
jgi:hypothetical protein